MHHQPKCLYLLCILANRPGISITLIDLLVLYSQSGNWRSQEPHVGPRPNRSGAVRLKFDRKGCAGSLAFVTCPQPQSPSVALSLRSNWPGEWLLFPLPTTVRVSRSLLRASFRPPSPHFRADNRKSHRARPNCCHRRHRTP